MKTSLIPIRLIPALAATVLLGGCSAYGGLGGSQHDDKDREHLAVVAGGRIAGERDVVEVGGVEYELYAQKHADGVAPGEHAEQPHAEQCRSDHKVMPEADGHEPLPSGVFSGCVLPAGAATLSTPSLRESTTAPTRTESSTSDASSKGRM